MIKLIEDPARLEQKNHFSPSVQDGVLLTESVHAFLSRPRNLLIDGAWVPSASGRAFETFNPATGGVLAHIAEAGNEDVDRAVVAAERALQGEWATTTPAHRGRILLRLADLIEQHADTLAILESLDNGKSFAAARHGDIPFAADTIRYMAGLARSLHGETVPLSAPFQPGQRFLAYTVKEPIGVVGQIIPWNFPLMMTAWKIAPALAAGCAILLKPAEQTPLTALYLGQLALEAGVPPGVLNVLPGFGEIAGAAIAGHPRVTKVAFTGSTEVGICFLGSLGCSERPSAQVAQAAPRNLNSMLLQEVTSLANAGDAEAQYHIALRHEAGTGTEKNSVQALIWFKKAADQGYAPAQASLAARIEERATTPDEFREAFELYLAAAKAGHPQAQSRAGQRYDEGRGTIQDYHEALRWFQAAAAQGDAPAQYNLGVAYDEGKGVSIDHKKAVEFYLQAAEQGHMLAQYNLGASYGNGQGVLRDDVQAYKWFALAAAQGRENAAANCQVLVREMAPEQIAEAKKLVADFKPTKGQP